LKPAEGEASPSGGLRRGGPQGTSGQKSQEDFQFSIFDLLFVRNLGFEIWDLWIPDCGSYEAGVEDKRENYESQFDNWDSELARPSFCLAGDALPSVEIWLFLPKDLLRGRQMDDCGYAGLLPV
jgi:hypothetical protein